MGKTPEEIEAFKTELENARLEAKESQKKFQKLLKSCPHDINVPTRFDGSQSAYCKICGIDFGWYCPESPDHACHYFSTEREGVRGVELIDSTFCTDVPELNDPDHDPDYETDDSCLFCYDPEERK